MKQVIALLKLCVPFIGKCKKWYQIVSLWNVNEVKKLHDNFDYYYKQMKVSIGITLIGLLLLFGVLHILFTSVLTSICLAVTMLVTFVFAIPMCATPGSSNRYAKRVLYPALQKYIRSAYYAHEWNADFLKWEIGDDIVANIKKQTKHSNVYITAYGTFSRWKNSHKFIIDVNDYNVKVKPKGTDNPYDQVLNFMKTESTRLKYENSYELSGLHGVDILDDNFSNKDLKQRKLEKKKRSQTKSEDYNEFFKSFKAN